MKAITHTDNSDQTMEFGEALGRKLRAGDVVALFGDLGAGKTTLTKGIAKGMNVEEEVHSPTFTLIHEHLGPTPLYHVDLYRLETEAEVESIGIEEYIHGDGVTVIEWADRMKSMLPQERLDIELRRKAGDERALVIETESRRLWDAVMELTRNADSSD
ncbi:MAG: tRNA (adenosine(37)-N6)-threonylcarbamoyltransferase complex ATPase subunit type 1 TsaE [Armatimonadetes bacterium]|nr:tRNA (adenosine(37)-N6)-threonylcarbamoyltransferase complex ATPase subunit type 1 TsaE [Armatimonadota bacterium]